MLRKKLKETLKDNSNSTNKDISNINKIQVIKSLNPSINYKKIEKITKNNLPELRLSKPKPKIESEINSSYKTINQSNINIKNRSEIQNKKIIFTKKLKHNSLSKINDDIIFPKIANSLKNNNLYKQYGKNNNEV